ncbi:ShlB/FhaC/HecB family hemolysin secretion/activation protein [Crenobacter luteus]|uniref:Uncharacterized protein n=1 Tax=Crenobacter luteus TaxID=1452487 RepID=A0A165F1G0_9NEIS|nr:POTRA domain-containing protein [Crenobacter luteus]KZE29702.1 hypothetical protein AVW16_13315 [Crenobacter luteus]
MTLTLSCHAAFADSGSPFRGNPLDTLPAIAVPDAGKPPLKVDIAPAPTPAPDLLDYRLAVQRVDIEGVAAIPFDQLAPFFAGLAGREVALRELITGTEAVTRLYQQRGYPLSFAYLPVQDFQDGVVRIIVVEGYVGELIIEGDAGPLEARLRRTLAPLLAEKPLTRASFERYTNLIAQIPGLSAKAELRPPTSTGGAGSLKLDVVRKTIQGGVGLEYNHPGARGIFSLSGQAQTGQGEQLSLTALAPPGRDHEKFYGLQYSQLLGYEGTQIKLEASDYRSRPETPLQLSGLTLRRELKNSRAGLLLSHPFLLSNTQSLSATAGAYLSRNEENYRVEENGTSLRTLARLTVVNAGFSFSRADRGALTRVGASVYQGLETAGARQELNAFDLDFTRASANLSRTDDWPARFASVLQLTGQYSRQNLPSSEQIGFGGRQFGRAYPAGEVAGDHGWGVSLELQRGFRPDQRFLKLLQPFLLVEHARVGVNRGQLVHDTLGSVAVGLRLTDSRHYNLELDVAKPTADVPSGLDSRKPRWNASYSYRLM